MKRLMLVLAVCGTVTASVAIGQERPEGAAPERHRPLSLADCLALARVTHENVIIAAQRVRDAHAGLESAEAGRYPTANLQASFRSGNLGTSIISPGAGGSVIRDTGNTEVALNVSWTLFDSRRPRLIERARHLEEQSRAGALGTLRDLDLSVASAFIDFVRAQRLADLQTEVLGLDRESLRIATAREQIGDGTKVETAQAQAQVALVAQQLLSAQNTLEKARLSLLAAMGLSEDTGYEFALEGPPTDVSIPPLRDCVDRAYTTRDDIESIQRALDVSHVDLALARLAQRISYQLSATGYNSFSREENPANWQVAFTATLPIFDGGAAKSQLRSAEARQIISQAEVSAALRKVWQDVTGAYRDAESARERVVASRFSELAAQTSLDRTQASFAIGLSSFFETLDARLQYYQARQQVLEAEADLFRSYWALHRAAPGVIAGVNPLADPTQAAVDAPYDPPPAPEAGGQ
jgi:multidrug efflux system outer membrane protein